MPDISIENLVVEYPADGYVTRPIDGLSATIGDGQMALLLGPSGCGKTTMLSCLGGIQRPTSGSIRVDDLDVTAMTDTGLKGYRRSTVGFVFQAFNLVASLTALDNVAAPLIAVGVRRSVARKRAADTLQTVGLSDRSHHRPGQLSGGQQQRVAVARGLVHDAPVLLADEPTANLDYVQAETVVQLLRSLASTGRTVIVSTHDDRLLPVADAVVQMKPMLDEEHAGGRKPLAAGETLFAQGDRGGLVYLVRRGTIEIVRHNPDGTEHIVATREAGTYFGELGPMLGQPRSATARARTRSIVTGMTLQEFRVRSRGEVPMAEVPVPRD